MMAAILSEVLAGSPWATAAGVALIIGGVALLAWHLRRQHRAATWETREARQQAKRRHPAYRGQRRHAGQPARRVTNDTVFIPRYTDATMYIPRQRDGRR